MLYDVMVRKGQAAEYHGSFALGNAIRKAEQLHGEKSKYPGSEVAVISESGKVMIF